MAYPKTAPLIYELNKELYFSDGMVYDYGINPDNVIIKDADFSERKVEVREITDKDIPQLFDEEGLFAKKNFRRGNSIIKSLPARYYRFTEWQYYGKEEEENNVIRIDHQGNDIIVEPWKPSKWKKANDTIGSLSGKKVNACFVIKDDNKYGLPLIELCALKNIKKHDQIFVGYGKRYWQAYGKWLKANKK